MKSRWKHGNSCNRAKKGTALIFIKENRDRGDYLSLRILQRLRSRTNLDRILKSGDITLLTMVHLVKAMVFPVVMYGCESWTIKKAERRRINCKDTIME